MAWALIHAAWMHYLLAICNAHDWTMKYVTTFSTEIFSLLNSIIYFHKAIQELQRAHDSLPFASFLYSIIGAIGTCLVAIFLSTAESWQPLFHRYLRMGLSEYAAAISIVIFIGVPHLGELASLQKQNLQVSTSFRPTSPDRTVFFVEFWHLPVRWVFAATVPGFIITVLFFFDHEVSSIICTTDRYGIKKYKGFAWDIVLLGTSTAICGILGIPPANGLLPQAPLHSESLMHTVKEDDSRLEGLSGEAAEARNVKRVYEQRWSHFLHAAGILIFTSPPFMHVLGLTPTSVLAGLFLFMGEQSLSVKLVFLSQHSEYLLTIQSPVLFRVFYMLTPMAELPTLPGTIPNYWPIHAYTASQIAITVGIFVITTTKAAPVFPIIILALVPIRLLLMKHWWDRETLRFVDVWACKKGTPEDDEDTTLANDGANEVQVEGRRKEGSLSCV